MGIGIILSVPHVFHQTSHWVSELEWNRFKRAGLDILHGFAEGHIGAVAFGS